MLLIAIAGVGLQMDRRSRYDVGLAHKVPSVMRAYALGPLATEAYAKGNVEQGLVYARSLVLRRPVPAENLALLAKGLFETQEQTDGASALLLSAQRGWRDEFTQALMVNSALAGKDPQTAAQRTLALWRTDEDPALTKALTKKLLAAPGGLTQFTSGMIGRDRWGASMLLWAINAQVPIQGLEGVSQSLSKNHIKMSCDRLSSPLRRLARAGDTAGVRRIWSQLCAGRSSNDASDFAFEARSEGSPFGWRYPAYAGLTTNVSTVGGQSQLEYRNDEYMSVLIATRLASLDAGDHAIRVDGDLEDGKIVLKIRCFYRDLSPEDIFNGLVGASAVKFKVPSQCRGQEIEILTGHGKGTIRRVDIK